MTERVRWYDLDVPVEHDTLATSEIGNALERADELERAGRLLEAVDVLTEVNRVKRDAEIERRLVQLRHLAFEAIDRSTEPRPWPAGSDTTAATATVDGITPELVRTGILERGYVHVRGFVPPRSVERLVAGIDESISAADTFEAGAPPDETTPWFEPFKPAPHYPQEMKRQVGNRRKWVHESGGVWTADSPHMMFELFDVFAEVGLTSLISSYLGERPAIAVDKCTLRRVEIDSSSDWHQDGAFLGTDIRVLNAWVALSHCGRDAPGLDIVPRRLDEIVQTGTEGAQFGWSVGPGAVERVAAETPVVRPIFEPGDVMLFDEYFLHRTAVDPTMTRPRYAVETWFFAPSLYPGKYVPLVV